MVDKKSFLNAINKWYKELKDNCNKVEVIFVGMKIDLRGEYVDDNGKLKKDSEYLDSDLVPLCLYHRLRKRSRPWAIGLCYAAH